MHYDVMKSNGSAALVRSKTLDGITRAFAEQLG